MVIVGAGAAARADGVAVLAAAAKHRAAAAAGQGGGWNAFNVLHTAASRVAGLDLGFVPARRRARRRRHAGGGRQRRARGGLSARRRRDRHAGARQGLRDLPGQPRRCRRRSAPTWSCRARPTPRRAPPTSITEGRAQMTSKAAFAPGDAKEDWAIIRALSAHVGHTLPYDSLSGAARGHVQGGAGAGRASTRSSPRGIDGRGSAGARAAARSAPSRSARRCATSI